MSTSSTNMVDMALWYAQKGWLVLPCKPSTKVPLIGDWPNAASTDPEQICSWWGQWPTANIGCVMGPRSGVFTLDVDLPKKTGDPDGHDSLAALEAEHGPLPATLKQRTGSGGTHYIFKYPNGRKVISRAGKVAPGIDARGEGGFIVVAPSRHPDGGTYEWVPDETDIADAPEWLLDKVAPLTSEKQEAPVQPRERLHETRGTTPYGKAALDEEARKVSSAREGTRNDTLNAAAFALGQLVAGGEIESHEAEHELLAAAAACGLSQDEARKTIASGLKAGERDPRSAPQTKEIERTCGTTPGSPGRQFSVREDGVYFLEVDKDGNIEPHWVCSPLRTLAETRDEDGEGRGLLLEVIDSEGHPHRWAMPSSLRAGNGDAYRAVLLDKGLRIAPGSLGKQRLDLYLSTAKPEAYARCVSRTGWHGNMFVFPDEVIGELAGEEVVLQGLPSENPFRQKGTLEDWQKFVGRLCAGNSRLALAVSTAIAAPLVGPLGAESGGFHFVGQSSSGKTTGLQAAGSVCGGGPSGYIKQWRATDNGLEGVAAAHCDNPLCLDEISQAGAKTASEVAYMLGNGQGKARAKKDGGTRKVLNWNLLFLSSGEVTLADKIEEDGRGKAKAGQTVRVVDIPADAGTGKGLFENLHGCESPEAFARQLKEASRSYYGTAQRAFLRLLVQNLEGYCQKVRERMRSFEAEHCPEGADGQVHRVCGRFALVAAAGELATEMGILPWPAGEATTGAVKCFQAWLGERGGTEAAEVTNGMAQVRRFFQEHGSSRFEDMDEESRRVYGKRAGVIREVDGVKAFCVFPEVFSKEVCSGFNLKMICNKLKKDGVLLPGKEQNTRNVRIGKDNQAKMYVVSFKVLGDIYKEIKGIDDLFVAESDDKQELEM